MEVENKTSYDRNKSSIDAQIEFINSIGGMKDVKEITPEFKEKMAEDLERFWKETPLERIAQDS